MKIPLEDVFSSRGAVRIIKTLVTRNSINISRLIRETKLSNNQIKKYVDKLISYGFVIEMKIGRVRIYKCNPNSKYLPIIREFITKWESVKSL